MAIKHLKPAKGSIVESKERKILVSDYMITNLITFSPDQLIVNVMDILIKQNISGGPVVNEKNELLGIVSERDCMKQISESRYFNMPIPDAIVDNHMAKDVDTMDKNMTIFEAANIFYSTGRKRFPIVEDGKLIGQISRRDIVKAALEM
ncbi:MAG: inosine-5-monophosphate dehydrogenase [Flavobacteriaceae bacterium]|nr:MAG: inosine-5-monophosphate dehydrogenase [Flavobacteriaceae bacterium]